MQLARKSTALLGAIALMLPFERRVEASFAPVRWSDSAPATTLLHKLVIERGVVARVDEWRADDAAQSGAELPAAR